MSDSTEVAVVKRGRGRPPSKKYKMTAEQKAKLEAHRLKAPTISTFSDLPIWVRTYAANIHIRGMKQTEALQIAKRSISTLKLYLNSPAYLAWVEQLKTITNDPMEFAQAFLRANASGVAIEYILAYEHAIAAGDYDAVGKMSQDLLDRVGLTKKKERKDDRVVVSINLGGGSLEPAKLEADYSVVEVEDYEIVSDDD